MTITQQAQLLGLSTEELFLKAFNECGGIRYGLHAPKELHGLWRQGWCSTPPYVTQYLKRHTQDNTVQPLLL